MYKRWSRYLYTPKWAAAIGEYKDQSIERPQREDLNRGIQMY